MTSKIPEKIPEPAFGGNLFRSPPRQLITAENGEQLDVLLDQPGCRIERILSTGQATPPGEWYDQTTDEFVALLTGRATLRIATAANPDGDLVDLSPGDWLLLPAHCRHRVEQTSPNETTVWLAVHVAPHETPRPKETPRPLGEGQG